MFSVTLTEKKNQNNELEKRNAFAIQFYYIKIRMILFLIGIWEHVLKKPDQNSVRNRKQGKKE